MAKLFAAIVGIEKYQELKPVLFAEIGCPVANQLVLINAAATKTAIEADLLTLLSRSLHDVARLVLRSERPSQHAVQQRAAGRRPLPGGGVGDRVQRGCR